MHIFALAWMDDLISDAADLRWKLVIVNRDLHGMHQNKWSEIIPVSIMAALHMLLHDDVIEWKHFPPYWPFVWGIHRSPVNSPHKVQWPWPLMFSLICALNKGLSTQSWGWWFEMPSRSLWRHCNILWNVKCHIEHLALNMTFICRKLTCKTVAMIRWHLYWFLCVLRNEEN